MNKYFWVGRNILSCLLIFKTNIFSKHTLNTFKTWNIFKSTTLFMHSYWDDNHYKVSLNEGAFQKYFQKPLQSTSTNKANDLESN